MKLRDRLNQDLYFPLVKLISGENPPQETSFSTREVVFLHVSALVIPFIFFVLELPRIGLYSLYCLPLIYGLIAGLTYTIDGAIQLTIDVDKVLWIIFPSFLLVYLLMWSTSGSKGFDWNRFVGLVPIQELVIVTILNILLGKLFIVVEVSLLVRARKAFARVFHQP